MKREFVLILGVWLCFSTLNTSAQISMATRAFKEMEAGNLGEARFKIDKAMQNELAQKHKRAWYYYGRIYEESFSKNKNPVYARDAIKGYVKSINLEKDQDAWADVRDRLHKLGEDSRKEGVARFKKQEFEDAEMFFLASMHVSHYEERTDSINYLNVAVTYDKLQDYDKAVAYLDTCISWGYQRYQCAALTLKIYKKQGKQKMVDTKIAEYRKLYPESEDILLVDVNNQIANNRGKEAISTVSESIKKYPNNGRLYVIRADTYLHLRDIPKAEADYKKGSEIDPKSFETQKATGDYFATKDVKKAILYYEAAYAVNPKKDNIGDTLLKAYKTVGNTYKYQTLKAKMR
jgi:tetratricopeptide (TPR) repeat protein